MSDEWKKFFFLTLLSKGMSFSEYLISGIVFLATLVICWNQTKSKPLTTDYERGLYFFIRNGTNVSFFLFLRTSLLECVLIGILIII